MRQRARSTSSAGKSFDIFIIIVVVMGNAADIPELTNATIMWRRRCFWVIGSHHPGNPVATVATASENTIPGGTVHT